MGKVIALSMLIALAGCQTTKGNFCSIAKPIRPSHAQVEKMTDAQVKELLAYLKKGERLCGWRQ